MNKLYLILGITAIIVLGYSFYLYFKPISSEETKQTYTEQILPSNQDYRDYKVPFDESGIPKNAKL